MGRARVAGFVLTFVFLGLVLWKVNLAELWRALASANYLYVLPAALTTLASYVLRTLRWRRLLAPTKLIPFRRLFPVLMIGFMANNVLPARLGEFVRAYTLGRKESISRSLSFATVLLERLLDGLALVTFLALVSLLTPLPGWEVQVAYVASAIFLLAALGVLALLLWEGLARRAIDLVLRPLPARLAAVAAEKAGLFIQGLGALRRKRTILALAASSLVVWSVEGCTYFLVLRAFGLPLALRETALAALTVLVVVNLGIMLPSAPGYVGAFQFFAVLALGAFGVGRELALSSAIVAHGVQYLVVTGLGLAFFWREQMSFRRLGEAAAV